MDEIVIYEMGETPIPNEWDYHSSILKMRGLVLQWKSISVEILKELYIAKQKLSAQGVRNDIDPNGLKLVPNNIETLCESIRVRFHLFYSCGSITTKIIPPFIFNL